MFKSSNFENELYRSMEKQLASNQLEDKYGFNKLAKVADYLHAAAEIFEQAGMTEQAEEITEVLQGLAQQLSCKTS
jgi:ATP-dependent protease HslVU (ClpYQ) ATPase subunit